MEDSCHEDMVKATGSLFEPLVVDALGLWHPHSKRMLKIIARKTAFYCCQTISRTLMFLYEQFSVKLWLFNARLILVRLALDSRDKVVGNSEMSMCRHALGMQSKILYIYIYIYIFI